jgi:opacity protein-like surface antigen
MNAAANRVIGFLAAMGLSTIVAMAAAAQQYARGDIGWSMARDAGITENQLAHNGAPMICGDPTCAAPGKMDELSSTYLVGLGIGTRVAPQFRIDLTYTFRGLYDLNHTDQRTPNPQSFRAQVQSHVAMANAYYDVPFKLGPVAPFVGGGIGYALNKTDELELTTSGSAATQMPGGATTQFAWQAMGGLSIELPRSMVLEIGYRYVDLGDITFDQGRQIQAGAVAGTTVGMRGSLSAHEWIASVRFGL